MRLDYKNRPSVSSPVFQQSFDAALIQFSAEFLKSEAFNHALTKGEAREVPVQDFFRRNLPDTFRVDRGEAVDLLGNRGPSLDLMISNKSVNFPFLDGDSIILPAEALLVSIEVKSKLSITEVQSILKAAQKLNTLKPFRAALAARRKGGRPADSASRVFHCVFAYNSDLSAEGWLASEYKRFISVSKGLDIPPRVVDRLYVANRGIIDISKGTGFDEATTPGSALIQFFMHIFNFLQRENTRRKSVPYLDYAGRMTGGWRSLKGALGSRTPS